MLNCRIWKASDDKTLRSPLVVGVWEAAKRFYAEYFDFLFDNTLRCYLVFASFFPTL